MFPAATKTALGALRVTTVTPTDPWWYVNGISYDSEGLMHVTETATEFDSFIGGVRVSPVGQVVIAAGTGNIADYSFNGGFPFLLSSGALAYSSAEPISTDWFVSGFAVNPLNGICLDGVAIWSPSALFASGEVGVWYDPSDFSTMFVESTGVTPVTAVGQSVGLLLDKSKGLVLGSELTNQGFLTGDDSATTATNCTEDGPSFTFTAASNELSFAPGSYVVGTIPGKWYIAELQGSAGVLSGNQTASIRGISSIGTITSGNPFSFRYVFLAQHNYNGLGVYGNATGTITVTKASVKELPGNHATQATAASRPILRESGGLYYLEFDGVDDSLTIATPGVVILGDLSGFVGAYRSANAYGYFITNQQTPSAYNDYEWGWDGDASPAISQIWYQSNATSGGGFLGDTVLANSAATVFTIKRLSNVVRFSKNTVQDTAISGTLTQPVDGGTKTLTIGRRSDGFGPLKGFIYEMILVGRETTAQETADTEAYINSKTGAY